MKYAYISSTKLTNGEIIIESKRADGTLLFGFRTFNPWSWRNQALDWTPTGYIPVFQPNKPASLIK